MMNTTKLAAVLFATVLLAACNTLKEGIKEAGDAVESGVQNVGEALKGTPEAVGEASNKVEQDIKN